MCPNPLCVVVQRIAWCAENLVWALTRDNRAGPLTGRAPRATRGTRAHLARGVERPRRGTAAAVPLARANTGPLETGGALKGLRSFGGVARSPRKHGAVPGSAATWLAGSGDRQPIWRRQWPKGQCDSSNLAWRPLAEDGTRARQSDNCSRLATLQLLSPQRPTVMILWRVASSSLIEGRRGA